MESTIDYSDKTNPNIDEIIDNLIKIDQNTKDMLKQLYVQFYNAIIDLDIKNIQSYPLDDNSVGIMFDLNKLDFRIELFYSPNGNSEYIATMKSGSKVLFYKKGTRSDFNEIRTILQTELEHSTLEHSDEKKYFDSGSFINVTMKN
jgi:hypothetical protein